VIFDGEPGLVYERFAHEVLGDSGEEIAIVLPAIDFIGILLRAGPPSTMFRELGEASRIHHPVVGSKRAFAVANGVNGNHGSEKGPGGSRMIEANEELHNLKEIRATCSLVLKETGFLE
jgi:hypothetical protein